MSLIVIIVTILVVVIISGSVLFNFFNQNSIEQAKKAVFLNDLMNFNSELNLYNVKQKSIEQAKFNYLLLMADENSVTYDGVKDTTKNIGDLIFSLSGNSKYENQFKVIYGELVYQGDNENNKKWAKEYGIGFFENVSENVDNISPIVNFEKNGENNVNVGNTVVTVIDLGGSNLDLNSLEYVWDTQNINEPDNGWEKFENGQNIIKTNLNGTYYLWIRAVDNSNNKVVDVSDEFSIFDIIKANKPILTTGMTPIKWDDVGNIIETTINDKDWYNYENKKWANVKTADGSMWVWIPRYEYKIINTHSNIAQTIDVRFLKDKSNIVTDNYILHPAFKFGIDELSGIWVAKFEASGTKDSINIKPGQKPLMRIKIDEMFTTSRNIQKNDKYGWNITNNDIDTHLIKNIEWGAVAYLSNSLFGKNNNINLNTDSTYCTGGGIENAYIYNVGQSTTGNVYGIYDMNGCSWEYVAAYVDNGTANLTVNGNSLYSSEIKYKDIYISDGDTQSTNYIANSNKKGDAMYETSNSHNGFRSWYNSPSYMVFSTTPFFRRGGSYDSGSNNSIFSFNNFYGANYSNYGFRPIIVLFNGI